MERNDYLPALGSIWLGFRLAGYVENDLSSWACHTLIGLYLGDLSSLIKFGKENEKD